MKYALIAGFGVIAFASPASAVVTSLPSPVFGWGQFGGGLSISNITVQQYVTPSGAPSGAIDVVNAAIYAPDTSPGDGDPTVACNGGQSCALIGNLQFQFALWRGSTLGPAGAINRVGATVFGGFQLFDSVDLGTDFSFLQIYTDSGSPNGTIDGGGFDGKVNSGIPRYNPDPGSPFGGWNYGGTAYQYDFFDVPFDRPGIDPAEDVLFETALTALDPVTGAVDILADFTWDFSTLDGPAPHDFLTGDPITFQNAPSDRLLQLYENSFPTVSYRNGIAALDITVPEPSGLAVVASGIGFTLAFGRIGKRRTVRSRR